jgi:peptidase M28-like protein
MVATRNVAALLRLLGLTVALPTGLLAQAASARVGHTRTLGPDLPRHYAGGPTAPGITAQDLMTRVYIYADDSMMGRDAFSDDDARATAYIEREVRRLGLEPAGEEGYFQYPLIKRVTDSTTSTLAVGDARYAIWRDFAPRDQGNGARAFDGASVVFGGSMGDTAHMIRPEDAAGRVVLITLARDSSGRPDPGSVNRGYLTARFVGAAAVAVAQLDHVPPGYVMENYGQPQPAVRGAVSTRVLPSYFYVTDAVARAMLGRDVETAAPGTAGGSVHGAIAWGDTRAPGRNVVAILRGSDPNLRNEYVAIGAHNDHIGYRQSDGRFMDGDSIRIYNRRLRPQGVEEPSRAPTAEEARLLRLALDSAHQRNGGPRADTIFNGADDDGSGSMGVLEIAEYFATARVKPKRSLLFVWHVGEEYGMLGSGYFTQNPTVPRDSIVAQLNVDMIGRGDADDITGIRKDSALIQGGPGYVQLIGSRRLSTELGDLVERVNTRRRLGMSFDYALDADGHPQNIYCRSDHWSYAKWGIPIVFFTTGGHSDYHQPSDEPEYIDYAHMERVATLIADVAEEVANLDHRVVVDHPRPDPSAGCRQ